MSVCRTVCVCVPCLNCSIGLCWVPKHSFSYVCMCIVSIIQTRIIICSFIFFPERSGIWCVLYLYLTLTLFRPNMTSFKTINDPNKLVRMSLIIHVCGINFMFGTFFYLVFSAIRVRIFGTGTNGTRTGHINAGIPLNRFEPIYCCCCCCSCVWFSWFCLMVNNHFVRGFVKCAIANVRAAHIPPKKNMDGFELFSISFSDFMH